MDQADGKDPKDGTMTLGGRSGCVPLWKASPTDPPNSKASLQDEALHRSSAARIWKGSLLDLIIA